MEPFIITPSEACLLGVAWGEYIHLEGNWLIAVLNRRLGSFFGKMWTVTRRSIPEHEVPEDIEWGDVIPTRGFSASEPDAEFLRNDTEVLRETIDLSRRSFPELVVDYLDGCIGRSLMDDWLYPKKRQGGDYFRHGRQVWEQSIAGKLEDVNTRTPADCRSEIHRRLTKLVESDMNGYAEQFATGQTVGRLLAIIDEWESWLIRVYFDPDSSLDEVETLINERNQLSHFPRYRELAEELLSHTVTKASIFAEKLLAPAVGGFAPVNLSISYDVRYLEYVAKKRMTVAVVLGEILGSMRDKDLEVMRQDAAAMTPRIFALTADSTPERIGGQLQLVERAISTGAPYAPESIVGLLTGGIEAFVKTAWAEEFVAGRSTPGRVQDVLTAKSRSGTETEKKFAHIAKHLYAQFRHQGVHELASFNATWPEVRYLLAGMRTLYEMLPNLRAAKGK